MLLKRIFFHKRASLSGEGLVLSWRATWVKILLNTILHFLERNLWSDGAEIFWANEIPKIVCQVALHRMSSYHSFRLVETDFISYVLYFILVQYSMHYEVERQSRRYGGWVILGVRCLPRSAMAPIYYRSQWKITPVLASPTPDLGMKVKQRNNVFWLFFKINQSTTISMKRSRPEPSLIWLIIRGIF